MPLLPTIKRNIENIYPYINLQYSFVYIVIYFVSLLNLRAEITDNRF